MNRRQHKALEAHFGAMHDNPPAPFNPAFDPTAKARSERAAREMEAEGYYETHTREECAAEYKRRCAV